MLNYFTANLSLIILLLLASCTKEEISESPVDSRTKIIAIEINGCKGDKPAQEKVEILSLENKLIVYHRNALLNCCVSQLKTELEIDDDELKIYESSIQDKCNCVCAFDIKIEIKPEKQLPDKITVYRNNLKIKSLSIDYP